MEISSLTLLSELEIEDPIFIDQREMNNILDQFTTQQMEVAFGEEFLHSFSSESYSSHLPFTPRSNNTFTRSSMEASPTSIIERPTKQIRTSSWNASTTNQFSAPDASCPTIISFCQPNSPSYYQQFYDESFKLENEAISPTRTPTIPSDGISQGSFNNESYVSKGASHGSKRVSVASTKLPSYARDDHIIAERKRREKLSQRFIALSAVLPCLKKADKASVLGEAINYVKQLQERVKILEEQTAKNAVESVLFVNKSQIYNDNNLSSSYENVESHSNESLPEIEVRVYDKNILIRIHCEKQKGRLVKTLAEIEKFHLSVVNTNVMPFSSSALDITVITQMEEDFNMTPEDLVKNLRCALRKFT